MANLFEQNGYERVEFNEYADVYVVNTCTVTNMSDRKSRQIFRRPKEINPDAILCVVGCYVQVSKEELSKLDFIDVLLGTNDRKDILKYVEKIQNKKEKVAIVSNIMKNQPYCEWEGTAFTSHERAEIKIQDGCDRFCSYCIIPYARGPVRSRSIDDITNEVKKLVASGVKEFVITGIHIASYGKDFKTGESLIDVIEKINENNGVQRIRLGSLEPIIITDDFIRRLKKLDKVCNHFHLSLQSGCNETLKRMNRRYTTEEFKNIVKIIRDNIPEVALTTDVIVGFPGETDEEFQQTYNFLKEIKFSKMHVFQYSPRKGTKAETYPNQIEPKEKDRRSKILLELSEINEEEFARKYIGKEIEVLFENEKEGHTTNYIKVVDKNKKQNAGTFIKVKPKDFLNDCLVF